MKETCGCCAGMRQETPATITNRPGLSTLVYRVGTHARFLASMQARLSSHSLTIPSGKIVDGLEELVSIRPLHNLTTRSADDPSIALLDAWATVADVLSFYQERIANEGYLRTATERRSILELARLIGYALQPGVASSVYLAFELEQPQPALVATSNQTTAPNALDQVPPVPIPAGSRAQSVPGPGELPQSFETSEVITARPAWNAIRPRLTRPQRLTPERFANGGKLYLKGIANNLKANDPLLLNFGSTQQLYRVMAVTLDALRDRSELQLQPWLGIKAVLPAEEDNIERISALIRHLERPPSIPPKNRLRLNQTLSKSFAAGSDSATRVVTALSPKIAQTLYTGWRNLPVTPPIAVESHALRVRANPFGSSAPQRVIVPTPGKPVEYDEWELNLTATTTVQILVAVFSSGGGDDPDDGPVIGSEPASEPGATALMFAIQIGGNDQATSDPLQLPAPGQTINATLRVGNTDVQLTVFGLSNGSSYQLTFVFAPWQARFTIVLNHVDDNFSVSSSSGELDTDNLSRVDVISHPDNLGVLALSAAQQLLVGIRAVGVLPGPQPERPSEAVDAIWLDAGYSQITPRSWVALEIPSGSSATPRLVLAQVEQAGERARAAYGISAKSSYLKLSRNWLTPQDTFATIRGTAVYAQSEKLTLAEDPIAEVVDGNEIELGTLEQGLEPGRWLIIAGERADIPGVTGVQAAELAMLAGVRQGYDPTLNGDQNHSTLLLAVPLAYKYKRDTVAIYANVAHATHGETRSEVLGSGDGSKALQSFTLRQSPLTYVSAPTASGIASTLEVRVNNLRWHAVDTLAGQGPTDHSYTTKTGDDVKTTVIFGDGVQGARLPSGSENVRAVYRVGIGRAGNVEAGKISLLASRPLGVKGVNNPLPATGGADRESRDQARRNAPLAITALDRLVSVQDYEDFARTFAGIGKASARRLSDGRRQVVHLTIAGEDDIPIARTSDLYRNLREALFSYGDSHLPITVDLRELLILIVDAGVLLLPDYLWESVEPKIRAKLLDTFSFDRRGLGQDALLSEVVATIQSVPGVAYVDVDAFGAIPETVPDRAAASGRRTPSPTTISRQIREIARTAPQTRVRAYLAEREDTSIRPAQIAILLPTVEETLSIRRLPA